MLYFMIIFVQSIVDNTSLFSCSRVRIFANVAKANSKDVHVYVLSELCVLVIWSM